MKPLKRTPENPWLEPRHTKKRLLNAAYLKRPYKGRWIMEEHRP